MSLKERIKAYGEQARAELINRYAKTKEKAKQGKAEWIGYDNKGNGLVRQDGKVKVVKVIGSISLPVGSSVMIDENNTIEIRKAKPPKSKPAITPARKGPGGYKSKSRPLIITDDGGEGFLKPLHCYIGPFMNYISFRWEGQDYQFSTIEHINAALPGPILYPLSGSVFYQGSGIFLGPSIFQSAVGPVAYFSCFFGGYYGPIATRTQAMLDVWGDEDWELKLNNLAEGYITFAFNTETLELGSTSALRFKSEGRAQRIMYPLPDYFCWFYGTDVSGEYFQYDLTANSAYYSSATFPGCYGIHEGYGPSFAKVDTQVALPFQALHSSLPPGHPFSFCDNLQLLDYNHPVFFNGTLDPSHPPGNPYTLSGSAGVGPLLNLNEFLTLSFSGNKTFAARYGPSTTSTPYNRIIELVDATSLLNCQLSYSLLATFESSLLSSIESFTSSSYDPGTNGEIFDLEGYSDEQSSAIKDLTPSMSQVHVATERAAVGTPSFANFATIGIQHNIIPAALIQLHAFPVQNGEFYGGLSYIKLVFIVSSDDLPSR